MSASPIAMNDFARQWRDAGDDVLSAVREVGESGWYVLGKQVASFEHALSARLGARHAIGCASGLDAIEIGLRALGMEPGQRVLTTPLSAYATTLAITRAGGAPVFVDVDDSGLLDLDHVEDALSRDPSIRFVVPVHLYGHALDLARLEALQHRFDVHVLEDCCQAIGARSGDGAVGSVGEVAALSFYPTKNLGALGDGGAVLTSSDALDKTCRALRDYGQSAKYVHDVPGLNSRLDELHAAVLARAFLPRLGAWTERRAAIAAQYLAGIRHRDVRPLPTPTGSQSVWHLFPVLVPAPHREHFMAHLKAAAVQSAVHYPRLIPDQRALHGTAFEVRGELTRAMRIAEGEVSLPMHPYLTDAEVKRVIEAVNAWVAP